MTRKSLLILLVAALVTGLAAWMTNRKEAPAQASAAHDPGQKLLAHVDPSLVSGMVVQSATGKVTLKRGEADTWTVTERDGFTADTSRLSGLVKSLFEMKIVQTQEAGPSQYGRLQLASPPEVPAEKKDEKKEEATPAATSNSGTVIRLLGDADKVLAEVVLGKSPETAGADPMAAMMGGGSGKFVRLANDTERVFLVSTELYTATADPADWVNKEFLNITGLKKVVLSGGEGFEGWEATRSAPEGTFELKDAPSGKKLSSSSASALSSVLASAQAADVLTKADVDALDKTKTRTAVLETFDGLTYTLQITPLPAKDGNTNYAVQAKVEGTYAEPAPKTTKKPEEMNEEEKKAAEAEKTAQAAARKTWDEKLAKEQAIAKSHYALNSYTVDALWKAKSEILEDVPAPLATPESAPPAALTPDAPAPATEPASTATEAVTQPISVTTPPIEVKPSENQAAPEAAPASDPAPAENPAPAKTAE